MDLSSNTLLAHLWFNSGVEELFAVTVLPGYCNPALIGPDTRTDQRQTIWVVPPPPPE